MRKNQYNSPYAFPLDDSNLETRYTSPIPKTSTNYFGSTKSSPAIRSSYSSPMTTSAYKNTTFDGISYIPPTSTSNTNSTPHSSTSVIHAFRELQAQSKLIEQERAESWRERDSLRLQLAEQRRSSANIRSKLEADATETLLNQRSANERLRYEHGDINARVNAEEDIGRSLLRGIAAQRTLFSTLQDDVAHNHAKIHTMERQIELQKEELSTIQRRMKHVTKVAENHSPVKNRAQYSLLHETISDLEDRLERINNARIRGEAKAASMQRYVDLVVRINSELLDTLVAREETRAKILRLSGKLNPRYAWPKDVSYTDVLSLVNGAAVATATGMMENNALRASESAIKSVIRAVSPGKSQERRAIDRDLARNGESESWLESLQERRRNSSSSYLDRSVSFLDAVSLRPSGRSVLDSSSYGTGLYSTGSRKKRRKKVRRSSEVESINKSALSFASTGSLPRSRRARTRDTVIARQGAITNATRFAAAATAAATTGSVQNTPTHPARSPSRERQEQLNASVIHPDNVQSDNRASFIPAGNQSSEFNVVASVSKANRAVKQLNATVASRVKSLHNGGSGDIFEEVPRISLHDMQQNLAAFKKLSL